MTATTVDCRGEAGGWICTVGVRDGDGSATTHQVTVSTRDLEHLAPGVDDPTDLVRRSFEFLLEREPKESILRSFDLTVIGRYFPEYEAEIRSKA